MNSTTRILIGVLVISLVLVSRWLVLSWKSERPEENPIISGTVERPQITVKTDEKVYEMGDDLIITINNNLDRPIRYYDVCSLHLCQYLGDDWFCEMKECHGSTMVIESGSFKAIRDAAQNLVETRLRYEFEYQIVSEDTLYIAHSNEFTIKAE
jgi:hypothetical protein